MRSRWTQKTAPIILSMSNYAVKSSRRAQIWSAEFIPLQRLRVARCQIGSFTCAARGVMRTEVRAPVPVMTFSFDQPQFSGQVELDFERVWRNRVCELPSSGPAHPKLRGLVGLAQDRDRAVLRPITRAGMDFA